MSVTYLLVFTCKTINQSLVLARRSGSGNSCARQSNLSYMMSTWGGLVSSYFLQLLSDSRPGKTKGREGEEKGLSL